MFYVYILKCSDNTLYTGYTVDINARLESHNSGMGAKYTRGRLPVEVVYFESLESKSEAMSREAQIKKLSRQEKLELIKKRRKHMKLINLGSSDLKVSEIALGCMRMADKTVDEAAEVIQAALDAGINFFDHADIYGSGKSEEIFAKALKKLKVDRKDIIIQSKCGISTKGPGYNFTKDYILESVDKILKRLETDYLDVLVLHRPDALMEVDQVNQAFETLYKEKKVLHFGVSNQSPIQMDLLKTGVKFPLLTNQVQLSLKHTPLLDAGFNVNLFTEGGVERGYGILEYAQIHDQTIQTWSPFYSGLFEEIFIDNDKFKKLNDMLDTLAKKYDVSKEAIAVAWILRHPAKMQVLIGSMTPSRITKIAKASGITLSHKEWYELYEAAGNELP